MVKADQLEK